MNSPILIVEVCLESDSCADYDQVRISVQEYFMQTFSSLFAFTTLSKESFKADEFLHSHVNFIQICEASNDLKIIPVDSVCYDIYLYQMNDQEREDSIISCLNGKDQQEDTVNSRMYSLPCTTFKGLWESLIFDQDIPMNLLHYIHTAMLFAEAQVDSNIININRLLLLHGPPGTGKTSLCKALAQKLSIRLSNRYSFGHLIEINAHSLFSKYFSESGKLVMKMFQQIDSVLEDPDSFVIVLIDEVESLTAARKAAISGLEPSDSLRVVNALLTQIDHYRSVPNVLVLATTNLLEAIDPAFIDRADIKQYIGNPSQKACYEILRECLTELMKRGILSPKEKLIESHLVQHSDHLLSRYLMDISSKCHEMGVSGRYLRKLPFLIHAHSIRVIPSMQITYIIYNRKNNAL